MANRNDFDEVPDDFAENDRTRYVLKAPVVYQDRNDRRREYRTKWITIGFATSLPDKFACHIDTIPLNWDGNFYLFPKD